MSSPDSASHGTGRRMMEPASRCQAPATVPLARVRGSTRALFTRSPMAASSAGRNDADAATATTGTIMPPRPIERMNGSGMSSSSPKPIATATPETIVVRPAVRIVARTAASTSRVRASSCR